MTWPSSPRPARRSISRNLIIRLALEILREGGLDAVSMRRIAQGLGTGPASLYAHVRNKEQLYELMLDELLGDVAVPEPDPSRWREQLKNVARRQLRVLTEYPGIARVAMQTTVPTGPNALRLAEGVLALLRAGGLDDRTAALAFDALALWCSAFALEVSAARTGETDAADTAGRGDLIAAYVAERPAEFPNLLSLGPTLNATPPQERFEFALEVFLAGLTAMAGKR